MKTGLIALLAFVKKFEYEDAGQRIPLVEVFERVQAMLGQIINKTMCLNCEIVY